MYALYFELFILYLVDELKICTLRKKTLDKEIGLLGVKNAKSKTVFDSYSTDEKRFNHAQSVFQVADTRVIIVGSIIQSC